MSRGSSPYLLSMALAAPVAGHALGLGEIHIDSKLNQPLTAHIDLLGARDAELASLSATIAGRDAFQRAGMDRPAFLNSAQFSVSRDRQDRPVLALHSRDAFTEPVIELLVELHWPGGALIREYTLLLDPVGTTDTSALNTVDAPVSAQPASPAPLRSNPTATPVTHASIPSTAVQPDRRYTVRPRDTLHGIARKLGARTRPEVRRLMMSLFHLNPEGFEGNINRLRSGVTLQIPAPKQLALVPAAQAEREFRQQMKAWRLEGRPENLPAQAKLEHTPQARTRDPVPATPAQDTDALVQRIAALEKTLAEIRQQIAREDAQLQGLRQQAPPASAAAAPAKELQFTKSTDEPAPVVTSARKPAPSGLTALPAVRRAAGIGAGSVVGAGIIVLILGALTFWGLRRRRPSSPDVRDAQDLAVPSNDGNTPEPAAKPVDAQASQPAEPTFIVAESTMPVEATPVSTPPSEAVDSATHDLEETLVIESASGDFADETEATTRLRIDENLADLEKTAQHVFIEGELNSGSRSTPFVERRRSVIDVLRAAIDKEPHRSDLKLKLLELYYATSAANLASFLEVAKKISREPDMLASSDWDRIVRMGRTILPDEKLFLEDPGTSDEISAIKENVA